MTSDHPTLKSGTVFANKYRIERLIGEGGFGAVYEVKNELGWQQALKVLHPEIGANPVYRKRFLREMHIARDLLHENAVAVRDAGEDDGSLYYTMDYVDGRTVSSEIKKHGRIEPRRAVDWALQVLSFLRFLNAKGYLHRDLKPANLMIEVDEAGLDRVRVLDLGIARTLAADSVEGQTMLTGGMIIGTPVYMAPEHIAGDEVDQRIDFYALGVILYECLAGKKPFTGTTVQRLYHAIHTETPTALPELIPGFAPELWDVIETSISKDRDQRYPDAESFSRALEACKAPQHTRDWDPTILDTAVSPPAETSKSKRPTVIVGGIAVVALVIVAAIFAFKWTGDDEPNESGSGGANGPDGGTVRSNIIPKLAILSPAAGTRVGESATLELDLEAAEDPRVSWSIDGSPPVLAPLRRSNDRYLVDLTLPTGIGDGGGYTTKELTLQLEAGGRSTTASIALEIDTVAPSSLTFNPKSGSSVKLEDGDVELEILALEALASATIDGEKLTPNGSIVNGRVAIKATGSRTVAIRVVDGAGNAYETNYSLVVIGEESSPVAGEGRLTVKSPRSGQVVTSREVSIEIEVSGPGTVVIDGKRHPVDARRQFRDLLSVGSQDGETRTLVVQYVPAEGAAPPDQTIEFVVDNVLPTVIAGPEERPGPDGVTLEIVASEKLGPKTRITPTGSRESVKFELNGAKASALVPYGARLTVVLADVHGNEAIALSHTVQAKRASLALPAGFSPVGSALAPDGLPRRIVHDESNIELVYVPATPPEGFSFLESESIKVGERLLRKLAKPYYLGVTEVTLAQLQAARPDFVPGNDYSRFVVDPNHCDGQHPVVRVSWSQARAFCAKYGMDLPTEAQWEWACRVETQKTHGTVTKFLWGETFDGHEKWAKVSGVEVGEFDSDFTAPVGSLGATPHLGLHDMIGNVAEWCNDESPTDRRRHMVRGGSYLDVEKNCTIYRRGDQERPSGEVGFRVSLQP